MIDSYRNTDTPARSIFSWILVFAATSLIAWSLVSDLNGNSPADVFVLARWSVAGLRAYLWLEGGLLAVFVIALGVHVISAGLAVGRGDGARLFGMPLRVRSRLPAQVGYVFVVLGAGLVALSVTTLVLLNSCRYMRLM